MTNIYQSFTRPVKHYLTITDIRYVGKPGEDGYSIHYGIKFELNKYYVYMKKDNRIGWQKVHGPFSSNYGAEQMILRIKIELAQICESYRKLREEKANAVKATSSGE